ncbi:MAG TPA: HAMP domain-containing sensor histidine kinase, partial [Bryobacteraceae bacterium]|nr:HAMP domain-containing sensor histidine kinase [Bryobacteraceae bacterium]
EVTAAADASVPLLDLRTEQFRRWAPGVPGPRSVQPFARRGGFGGGRGRGMMDAFARWEMYVRHRAGSLEAVVSRARWRNLAVTAGLLMLMGAAAVALARYTRREQRLAELQIGFVAGVSHELRTPLTVIHTAAYNLRGKVAASPEQVERYGALIQQESGRLRGLVDQILDFARAESGYVVKEPEPVNVETVIDEVLDSAKALIEAHHCSVEKQIEPGLPAISGDRVGLRHALANVLNNAAKYGSKGGNWIGVFASKIEKRNQVEIRIADRGPGIPADEQEQVFEPFFRGRMAVENQVHGTGLGLNLAKKIVEAHGGSIQVKSELTKGTVFTIRLPAAANARQP